MDTLINPYLISLSVIGIKGLSQKIDLRFHNKTFPHETPYSDNIKGIYGVNGAGKTSIIVSVLILKRLLSEPDFLAGHKRWLDDLINYESGYFTIAVEYCYFHGEKRELSRIYRYSITVKKGKDIEGYSIEKESLLEVAGHSTAGEEKVVFSVADGKIEKLKDGTAPEYISNIASRFNNTLKKSSLLSLRPPLENATKNDQEIFAADSFISGIVSLFYFNRLLFVYVCNEDIPLEPYSFDYEDFSKGEKEDPVVASIMKENRNRNVRFMDEVELETYRETTRRLASFVKLFKPSLRSIDLDAKEVSKNCYAVERVFDYGNYKINSYLESTGIKNLSNYFLLIYYAVRGGIVFIDEMDANINGVYLASLLSYLSKYAKGQLVFTSHNTSLMSVLKNGKHGIDFISPDHHLASWAKNGNYSPESQWLDGFIPGFAFNLEDTDYLSIFPPDDSFLYGEKRDTKNSLAKGSEGGNR